MRNFVCTWALVMLALGVGEAQASSVYRIVGIADGDTLTALGRGHTRMKCRLYGIDAPEKKQAFGQASKASLAALAFGRSADIDVVGRDRYGRSLCKVAVAGLDVNREQIARGMAWMYRQYASDRDYSDAEMAAQAHRLGIWRDAEPVAPWEFRRTSRRR